MLYLLSTLAARAFAPELDYLEIFRTSVTNFTKQLFQLNKFSFEIFTLSFSSHTRIYRFSPMSDLFCL